MTLVEASREIKGEGGGERIRVGKTEREEESEGNRASIKIM